MRKIEVRMPGKSGWHVLQPKHTMNVKMDSGSLANGCKHSDRENNEKKE